MKLDYDNEVRSETLDAARGVVVEALPWATFLPESDLDQLLSELVTIAEGAASLENLSPVAVLLAQWRHTAEVHSDPVLLDILSREPEPQAFKWIQRTAMDHRLTMREVADRIIEEAAQAAAEE